MRWPMCPTSSASFKSGRCLSFSSHLATAEREDRRLLVRYKDRNPAPLNGLEILMEQTYQKIIAHGTTVCLGCMGWVGV